MGTGGKAGVANVVVADVLAIHVRDPFLCSSRTMRVE